MRFRTSHQNSYEDRVKGLPNFLQVLHKIKPQKHFHVEKQQNNNQYESILLPYDKENRYAINLDTQSSSQSDCQVIQILKDPKIQCQKLNREILQARKSQNCQQIMYDILIKYISILTPIKEMKKIQPLVDSLSCFYSEIQPLVSQIKNKLCQTLIFQKFGVYDKAFHALLYHIKSILFCAKLQSQSKVLQISPQKSSNLKDCFLRILRICQKQFWQSRNQTNFVNLLQNVQVFIESQHQMDFNENICNILIDLLLLTIKKICSNLSPRMIKNSFFQQHSIKLNNEIFKQLSEQIFLTLKSHQPLFKSAWKCFQISDKRMKKLKRDKKKKAISVKKHCNFCQCPLFEDNLIKIYGCGHSFHSYCDGEKQSCIECSYISDERLYENIIYSKVYEKQQQNQNLNRKKKKQQKIKFLAQQKEQKLFYLKRKFKIFDYEQYSRQKITMNLMKGFESSNFY